MTQKPMGMGQDCMQELRYIKETLDDFREETSKRLDANTEALQTWALHQKEQNGKVGSMAGCIDRLTVLMDAVRDRQANHGERIASLEQSATHQVRQSDASKEADEWTREKIFEMGWRLAGVLAVVALVVELLMRLL